MLHSVYSSKQQGLVLKLDYEKAFDKVHLEFLYELLSRRGFGDRWMMWIHEITHNGSVGVKLNNREGNFFVTGKGLRQGDPLSPLLFNLVVDVLTKMLIKASFHNLIKGLCPEVQPGGIICLQYADDTVLFVDKNESTATNLKGILTCFEQVSGMRINYSKSELIPINMLHDEVNPFKQILGCRVGCFPIKYLGIPLHYDKLKKEDIQPLVDNILKRMAGWRGKLLSYAGRLVLIKSCLASIPVYLLSFFKFPKWAIELINSQMARCLWSDAEGHKKLHLANWHLLCMKKEFGGMGIPYLQDLNLCLLGSWVKRYVQGEGKIWRTIIDHKYDTSSPNIFHCKSASSSRFWKGVMWAAQVVKIGCRWVVGNGCKIHFWEDTWFGSSPLSVQYWNLYEICNEQLASLSSIWDGHTIRLSFRRTFTPALIEQWYELEQILLGTTLSTEQDALIWKYNTSGVYSSSSLYNIINFRGIVPTFIPAVWSLNVPPDCTFFFG